MKKGIIIIGILMAWLLLIGGVVSLLIAATAKRKVLKNSSLIIAIDYSEGMYFVDTTDIKSQLLDIGFSKLTELEIEKLNLTKAEKHLERLPFVADAQLYVGRTGKLHIDIKQKKPILRIYNTDNLSFYIDKKFNKIPCSKKFTAHVPLLLNAPSGLADYIDTKDTALFRQVCNMALHIATSEFWCAQVDEIIWNNNNTFTIIPNLGNHIIELGSCTDYAPKLHKLELFYAKNMSKKSMWDKYESLNVTFNNQIVCKYKKYNNYESTDTTSAPH